MQNCRAVRRSILFCRVLGAAIGTTAATGRRGGVEDTGLVSVVICNAADFATRRHREPGLRKPQPGCVVGLQGEMRAERQMGAAAQRALAPPELLKKVCRLSTIRRQPRDAGKPRTLTDFTPKQNASALPRRFEWAGFTAHRAPYCPAQSDHDRHHPLESDAEQHGRHQTAFII